MAENPNPTPSEEPGKRRRKSGLKTVYAQSSSGVRDVKLTRINTIPILNKVRFLPLWLLLIGVAIATAGGYYYVYTHPNMVPLPPAHQGVMAKETDKNAQAAPLPTADDTPVAESGPGSAQWLQDCAPLPKTLVPSNPEAWVGANAEASEAAWAENMKDAGGAIKGENGFYFWGDVQAQNFSQALGREPLTKEKAQAWVDYFTKLQAQLSAQGQDLVIIVGPGKWDIYPQNLPAWAQKLRGNTNYDYVRGAGPALPWIDVREGLRAASLAEQEAGSANGKNTFSAFNSHWTTYGGYLAWQQMGKCLGAWKAEYQGLYTPEITGTELQDASSEYASVGVTGTVKDWSVPVFAGELPALELRDASGKLAPAKGDAVIDFSVLPVTSQNGAALSGPAGATGPVLFVRDSMGNALSPYLNMAFAKVAHIKHNLDGQDRPDVAAEAAKQGAKLVVFEFTERYFVFDPPQL